MKIVETHIKGLLLIDHSNYKDNRGSFSEVFRSDIIKNFVPYDINFCQDNIVKSNKYVLRGLHFQKKPYNQSKLISVISGKIMDVAVDIRKDSKTYGKYFSCVLDDYENRSIFIPKGFAHGYLSLSNNTIIKYKVDNYYNPNFEGGISYDDKHLDINWGVSADKLIISEKDLKINEYLW